MKASASGGSCSFCVDISVLLVVIIANPMKKSNKPKPPVIHPKAQVLITGASLTPDQAKRVIEASKNFCLQNWCGPDGAIGHIDAIQPNASYDKLYGDLLELSKFFFLDLGVSVMSGPPKTFTTPVISFSIKDGTLKKGEYVHYGHPPPRRLYNKDVQTKSTSV